MKKLFSSEVWPLLILATEKGYVARHRRVGDGFRAEFHFELRAWLADNARRRGRAPIFTVN